MIQETNYQKHRKGRIGFLESIGYFYITPEILDEEGWVITPSGFSINSETASHYLKKLREVGKRIQIESLRSLELIMLEECEDEELCEDYQC